MTKTLTLTAPMAALLPVGCALLLGLDQHRLRNELLDQVSDGYVRTSGLLDASQVAALQQVETIAIGMGLVGLGSQVRIARLRQVGGRPLVLGLASWVLVGGVSLLAVTLVG